MYIKRTAEAHLRSWLDSKKILLLLGARQVGKTTLLRHIWPGTDRVTYLNLDIAVDTARLTHAMPFDPKGAMVRLGSPDILIIDEAQRCPAISRTVKGWYDANIPTRVILSGSSSLNLLDQSAESVTGRNIKLTLSPLIFPEVLTAQPWYAPGIEGTDGGGAFAPQIDSLVVSRMVYGSYPEAVTSVDPVAYLNNLVSDFLLKDILQFGLVKTPDMLRRLLGLLAYQVGSIVSTNELATALSISRVTVERYLDLLERTYVIFRLPAYSTNPRKEIVKSKKIYFWDTGVRNALIGDFSLSPLRTDIGGLWENWIVAEFAKTYALSGMRHKLFFWRSRSGSEVDMVVQDVSDGNLQAYELKWSAGKPSKAFGSQYALPVAIITRKNFLKFLWKINE